MPTSLDFGTRVRFPPPPLKGHLRDKCKWPFSLGFIGPADCRPMKSRCSWPFPTRRRTRQGYHTPMDRALRLAPLGCLLLILGLPGLNASLGSSPPLAPGCCCRPGACARGSCGCCTVTSPTKQERPTPTKLLDAPGWKATPCRGCLPEEPAGLSLLEPGWVSPRLEWVASKPQPGPWSLHPDDHALTQGLPPPTPPPRFLSANPLG